MQECVRITKICDNTSFLTFRGSSESNARVQFDLLLRFYFLMCEPNQFVEQLMETFRFYGIRNRDAEEGKSSATLQVFRIYRFQGESHANHYIRNTLRCHCGT